VTPTGTPPGPPSSSDSPYTAADPVIRMLPTPLRQVRDTLRAHRWWQDATLSLVVLLLSVVDIRLLATNPHRESAVDSYAFIAVAAVIEAGALLLRRRAPHAVFAVVLGVCLVSWSLGTIHRSDVSLLVCVYGVARYGNPPRILWAAGTTVAALTVADFRVDGLSSEPVFGSLVLGTPLAAAIVLGLAARDRHAQLTALAERAARLEREREQRARLAVLAERARVSREMHDILGHTLAVVVGLADGGASQVIARPERGKEALQMIGETGRLALSELRRTLSALQERPLDDEGAEAHSLNPQPSTADLAHLLDRIRAAGPRVDYRTSGDLTALPRSVQLALYRIVQEAMTNSLKHAGPHTSVQVSVETDGRQVRITVDDTGPPDRPPPVLDEDTPGRGLVGIRERAALAGGTASAAPRAGGWRVRAVLPVTPHEEPAE
jgi:signal transduction histidine kinase